jgi:hypothetical protein
MQVDDLCMKLVLRGPLSIVETQTTSLIPGHFQPEVWRIPSLAMRRASP